jgi:hypothetical protein
MRRHWYYYAGPDHLYYFTPGTVRRLFALAPLDDVAVRPASKPLTLEYAALALAQFNPRLGRLAQALVGRCPRGLRSHLWQLRIGEMTVTARLSETNAPHGLDRATRDGGTRSAPCE